MDAAHWQGRRAVVTGGAGFLGRWLVRALADAGAEARVWDRVGDDPIDLLDLDATADRLARAAADGPVTVFHLAGQAGVKACHDDPADAFAANVTATVHVLEAARRHPAAVDALVCTSSNHVYGDHPPREFPLEESTPLAGHSPYAATKAAADLLCQSFGKSYALPVTIARITNSYGGDDPHRKHLVTAAVLAALAGVRPVITGSGRDRKGFAYVEDTVDGLLTLAEHTAARPAELAGEAFNLVPDEAPTVLELVDRVIAAVGFDLSPDVHRPDAEAEAEHLSNAKAKRVLGWSPGHTLDEGLAKTVRWYRGRR